MDLEGHYPQNTISYCIISNETQITMYFFQGRISAVPEIRADLFFTISKTRKSLETIYLTFIRSLLEYGDVIWDNCTQYEKNELDKIQNEAARITTGTTKLVSLDNFYKEVGWQTLHRRRQDHKLPSFISCLINSHLYICLP